MQKSEEKKRQNNKKSKGRKICRQTEEVKNYTFKVKLMKNSKSVKRRKEKTE
jgi:hypothetical protein